MDILLIALALILSFGNGANDNFKGFATVWGSDTLSYRRALTLATISTLAGCLASVFLAETLVRNFTGKGLISDAAIAAPAFISAVAVGAGFTVLLATRIGMPVSTTHALIGGLVGSGLAQGGDVQLGRLAVTFFLPLLASPFVAALLGAIVYSLVRRTRAPASDCLCVAPATPEPVAGAAASLNLQSMLPRAVLDTTAHCKRLDYPVRVSLPRLVDRLHIASAMAICFARGVNDTPKLAALLVAGQMLGAHTSALFIAAAMAMGGWFFSARVADTMSRRVTRLDHAQGVSANLVTAGLVLFASNFGMPVSTTHASVGAIAGVGATASTLNGTVFRTVLLSWLATLPSAVAAAFAAGIFLTALM